MECNSGRFDFLCRGETDRQCALREVREETGIEREAIKIDRHFRYTETYYPVYARLVDDALTAVDLRLAYKSDINDLEVKRSRRLYESSLVT